MVAACGDDDDADSVASPSAAVDATESPGEPDDDAERARLEAEAMELCPEEFQDSCVASYVSTGLSGLAGLLCVNEDTGTWFMEPPGEGVVVGEPCDSDSTHIVAGLVNYEE